MLATGARCKHCQRHVLRTFINSFITPSRELHTNHIRPSIKPPHSRAYTYPRRLFSEPVRRYDEDEAVVDRGEQDAEVDIGEEAPRANNVESQSNLPWYLQNQESVPDISPFSERTRIPDLPKDPPPILEHLLEKLCMDIGLDYLTLLDLRKLDPPPALGSELIMILGTARSLRHLNVSADRLCRWLRSEYKLSPYADGLLGRNELKLKLRRKSRRAKIMNAAGVAGSHQADDGISSNWICVDVGRVEAGPDTVATEAVEPAGFVGFRSDVAGVKLVIQIMTEDKRGEMDLEGLWQGALDRAARRDERQERALQQDVDIVDGHPPQATREMGSTASFADAAEAQPGLQQKTFPPQQIRGFHTSVVRSKGVSQDPWQSLDSMAPPDTGLASEEQPYLTYDPINASSSDTSSEVLKEQVAELFSLDEESALQSLGTGESDHHSTSFLRTFHSAWPLFPAQAHFDTAITLHCHALHLRHPGYTKGALIKLFHAMEASAVPISEDKFIEVLDAILISPHSSGSKSVGSRLTGVNDAHHALKRNLGRAIGIMERMEAHGYDIAQDRIFEKLHMAVSYPVFSFAGPPPKNYGQTLPDRLQPSKVSTEQYHVREAMERIHIPAEPVIMDMVEDYAKLGNWSGIRKLWDMLPRHLRHRGPQMYAQLFTLVAGTGDQKRCQETLREYTLEMEREDPPVVLQGEVAVAVSECLVAACAGEDAFWDELRAKCRNALPMSFSGRSIEQPLET